MAVFGGQTCPPGVDDSFGPIVDSCARQFDFTLLFEQSIISIPPCAVFLLIAPWRIWSLRSYSQKTSSDWLSSAKLLMAVALTASQIVLLVYYTLPYTPRTKLSIPATVLALASAVAIVPLSNLEDRRSVRPSTLINSYLALSAVLDIPQLRTLYLIPGHLQRHLATIFSVSFAVKIILLGLEARNKRSSLIDGYRTLATETTSGIFSRSLFIWMNNLFKRGYKKVICFEDLGPIDDSLGSTGLHRRLLEAWTQQDHVVKQPLLGSLWKALKWSILSPVPPRLCYSGFLFAQPFLINRAITYLSQPQDTLEDDIGYGLIGAAACTYLGIALSNALFQRQLYRHITMVRGSLVSLIYSQSLSIEDQIEDPSAAVTLMSTDVDRICQSLTLFHDLWARPLELAIGITLLAFQIGWVCIMPIAVVVISVMFDSRVTMMIGGKVKVWSDAVQRRISLTADVLSGMKSVKMLGFTRSLRWMLQNERLHELGLQAKFRWSVVWLNTLGNVPPALTAAVTFIAYAIKAHVASTSSLNATQVFTSLALINLITTPASELLGAFPFAASCLGCLARIQTHLLQPSRRDHRIFTTSETSLPGEKTDDRDKEKIVVRMSQVVIPSTYNNTSGPLLQNFDFEFCQNSLTMIVGPSGSGKSTLLRTILGEARCQGTISISSPRITYCPQIPWLFTGTIKQNICGLDPDEFDEPWYTSVLYTCALDSYILSLPHADNTRIEGKTATLSGGQKQRLILARALYQRPRLMLLDDILSALDIKTETMVMTRLFGTDGLMSRLDAAVVLVTHTHRWESIADTIVTLDGTGNSTQYSNPQRLENVLSSISPGTPESEKPSSESKISETLETELMNGDLEPEVNMPAQPPERGGEAKDYIYYFKSVRLSLMLLFISSAAGQTICYYISQTILSWWTAADGSDQQKWLPIYLLLSTGNAIMYGVTVWVMFLRIVPESAANLHRILLDVVMNAPYSFFTTIDVGMILNRFSQDMTLIESQLPTGVLCSLIYLFGTIGSLALISMGSSYMALSIPIVLITLFVVQRIYLRTSRRLRAIELELRSPLYSHFMETLKGLSSLRVLNWEDDFTSHMLSKLDTSQVPYYLLYCAQRWLQLVLDLIVTGLAIVVMALAVRLRSSTIPSSLGLSLNNVLSFNQTLALLLQFWTQLSVSLGAIARTREFEEQTPVEAPPPSTLSSPRSFPPPLILAASWPSHGHISIHNLSAHYNSSSPALTNITLSILPGSKIGICGRSGSGKSSLLSCILRLVEPSSGSIVIDSIDLKSLDHQTLRERILTIPQEPFLLGRDVRWNLDPRGQMHAGRRDEEMIDALTKVSLWSLIEKRGGLSALVTTDFLSQGQKQLFSLARAILSKNSKSFTFSSSSNPTSSSQGGVLLLDEATSNIDRATDTLMQRVIRDEFAVFTILVVAHRLETILDSDRVLVLDKGRVVEFDAPQTLLGTESVFKELCKAGEHEREGDWEDSG